MNPNRGLVTEQMDEKALVRLVRANAMKGVLDDERRDF